MKTYKNLELVIKEKILLQKKILTPKNVIILDKIINKFHDTIKKNKKIMVCGNGGSAADAQHLAAEYVVRLNPKKNRRPLPMISLALDTSTITACGNDYSFDNIFSRSLEAIGNKGDLLLVISTSGMSRNILEVLKKAKKHKIFSISLLGNNGGKAKNLSDISFIIPNKNTARIQEMHIFIGHFILNSVEKKIFK